MTNTAPTIQTALANVMHDVREVAKKDRNTSQNFSFRGIDAVVNAVGPALRAHNVIVMPNVESYDYGTVQIGRNNTSMGHVRLKVNYRFTGPAGDSLDCVVVGEAMDSGDKATAKAMSVCFRTALLQALALPTDEPDPDSQSYERSSQPLHASPEVIARAVALFNTAENQEALDDAAQRVGRESMDDETRTMLRGVYLENKARLVTTTAEVEA